jgi:hypothetical protein
MSLKTRPILRSMWKLKGTPYEQCKRRLRAVNHLCVRLKSSWNYNRQSHSLVYKRRTLYLGEYWHPVTEWFYRESVKSPPAELPEEPRGATIPPLNIRWLTFPFVLLLFLAFFFSEASLSFSPLSSKRIKGGLLTFCQYLVIIIIQIKFLLGNHHHTFSCVTRRQFEPK